MALTKSGRDANLSAEELLERINALLPGIAARARQAEVDRRPHDETMRELVDADIMRMLVPKRFGGHEMGLATPDRRRPYAVPIVYVDGLGDRVLSRAQLDADEVSGAGAKEVFAEKSYTMTPIQPSPMLRIKQVPGGYEVDGRSSYSSGIMHADWVILAKSGGADARAFVVRKEDIEVDDVWHMSGMSATGSNDVIAHELFVPEHRTLDAATLFNTSASIHDNPLYRIPLLPFIYCEVMGVYVGGLEGATHAYEDIVRTKTRAHIGDRVAERQSTHVSLGQAHARLQAGNALLDRLVADTWALAEAGAFDIEKRLELKLRAGYINDLCRQSVNEMASMGGTSAFRQDSPLQRFFRDLNTLATHAFTDRHGAFELWGRQRLGLEPNSPLI